MTTTMTTMMTTMTTTTTMHDDDDDGDDMEVQLVALTLDPRQRRRPRRSQEANVDYP